LFIEISARTIISYLIRAQVFLKHIKAIDEKTVKEIENIVKDKKNLRIVLLFNINVSVHRPVGVNLLF